MMRGPCVLANLAAREEIKKTIMEIPKIKKVIKKILIKKIKTNKENSLLSKSKICLRL